jgi:uncharacterized protein (DUF3084 family)
MTSAYILIAAILVLGGLIAALGDRIGTKVGKARLRLFHLRPKQTAIVFTVITGIIISASTLAILFTLSKSLRQGIFQLDEILQKRRHVSAELEQVSRQKNQVEQELTEAEIKQKQVNGQLLETTNELTQTQVQLKNISQQANQLRQEVKNILQEKKQLIEQKETLKQQSQQLQAQVRTKDRELNLKQQEINAQDRVLKQQENQLQVLEKERQNLQLEINSRDEKIKELDESIALKDSTIEEREKKLISLEKELNFVQQQVEVLAQYYQTYQELRERPIALIKGQVLAIALLKIMEGQNVEEVIDKLLREANRTAMEELGYGSYNSNAPQRIVQITTSQVEQMKQQLSEGGEYFVRIITAGNYVKGEQQVRIFADISANKQIYSKEEIIATVSIDIDNMTEEELQERLDFLLSVTQFRARRAGVLGKIFIADGKIISLVNFLEQLQEYQESIQEIQAITSETTYTSGPLQISLVVIAKDGEEILRL